MLAAMAWARDRDRPADAVALIDRQLFGLSPRLSVIYDAGLRDLGRGRDCVWLCGARGEPSRDVYGVAECVERVRACADDARGTTPRMKAHAHTQPLAKEPKRAASRADRAAVGGQ